LDRKICVDALKEVDSAKGLWAIKEKEVTLGKTNPQKETMNEILDFWSEEYTARRAYTIHIVASDHRRKDTHIHTASTTVPVEVESKKVWLLEGNGKSFSIFCPIKSIA
jgi:hypothetical protein